MYSGLEQQNWWYKSTASSTCLTASEDFKSLIRKEVAQFKGDGQSARSKCSQHKHDMFQMMQDVIRHQELPSIVAEIQQQSTGVCLTTTEYKADMVAFQSNFQASLTA
jgi:hypothetical protein